MTGGTYTLRLSLKIRLSTPSFILYLFRMRYRVSRQNQNDLKSGLKRSTLPGRSRETRDTLGGQSLIRRSDNGFRGYTLASVILIRRLKMSDTCS